MANIDHSSRRSAHSHVHRAGRDLTEIDDEFIPGSQSNILVRVCLMRNDRSEIGP